MIILLVVQSLNPWPRFTLMGSREGCALGLGEGPQILAPTESPSGWSYFQISKMPMPGNMRPPTRKRQRLFRDNLVRPLRRVGFIGIGQEIVVR
jgi:hypothetical protein